MLRFLIPILTLVTTGCTTSQLEPVPGSITYGGQPATRLTKAPIGSTVTNRFRDQFGQEWGERYILQPDRSLKLVSRERIEYPED
tara:strand:+ start:981 stop:1235 length:255 start_codon:yes stop_codon:yes gene_type:complete